MKLIDIYNNLKTTVIGTKTIQIDKDLDSSLDTILKYSSQTTRNNYIELLKDIVNKVGIGDDSLLKDIRENQIEYFERSGRLLRYMEYDSIVRTIAHCARALNVLTDEIISPDDINKRSILVSLEEGFDKILNKDDVEKVKKDYDNIKRSISIEKNITKIVKSTMKKGDYFVEIIHSPKGEQAFTILTEAEKKKQNEENHLSDLVIETGDFIEDEELKKLFPKKIIIEAIPASAPTMYGGDRGGMSLGGVYSGVGVTSPINKKTFLQMPKNPMDSMTGPDKETVIGDVSKDDLVDDEYFNPSTSGSDETKSEAELKDIFITLHNPRYIIRLETERFRSCLGYLIFPKVDPSKLNTGFLSISNDIDAICSNILKQIKTKVQLDDDLVANNKDMQQSILQYLTGIENLDDLKVRFVPPNMMTHFRINVDIYDPYGESIFDCIIFDAKIFTALKTAQTIKRLTNSTEKRVFNIETGLPHSAKNMIETLKENMKKRKISIDRWGSLDSIPSLVATFEDVYLPMRDGKKYIEIDTLKWGGAPEEDIEPLKFIRDNIVANLNVPPAYVGLEENATNRTLITAESVIFARTIVAYQKQFTECMNDLFMKIYRLLYPKESNFEILSHIQVGFSPPKASIYEHTLEYLENASRAIQTLRDFGIPEEYLQKNYLSFLDWDDIEKWKIENKIKANMGATQPSQMGMAGGNMGLPGMIGGMGMNPAMGGGDMGMAQVPMMGPEGGGTPPGGGMGGF